MTEDRGQGKRVRETDPLDSFLCFKNRDRIHSTGLVKQWNSRDVGRSRTPGRTSCTPLKEKACWSLIRRKPGAGVPGWPCWGREAHRLKQRWSQKVKTNSKGGKWKTCPEKGESGCSGKAGTVLDQLEQAGRPPPHCVPPSFQRVHFHGVGHLPLLP